MGEIILRDNIETMVKKLTRKYNTRNPFELASCLNIKVMEEPLGRHIKGFYQLCPKNKVIHLNDNLIELDKIIVCAHELGHAILHTKLNILFLEHNTFYIKNRYEKEANKFASELLISNFLLEEYPNYFNIEQIAQSENLPIELLKLKFDLEF